MLSDVQDNYVLDNAAITVSCTAQPPGGASALIVAVMEPLHSIDPVVPAPNEFLLPLGTGPFANSWCIRCGPGEPYPTLAMPSWCIRCGPEATCDPTPYKEEPPAPLVLCMLLSDRVGWSVTAKSSRQQSLVGDWLPGTRWTMRNARLLHARSFCTHCA